MAKSGQHELIQDIRYTSEGFGTTRLYIERVLDEIDLLDDPTTGNIIAGQDSTGASVASIATGSTNPKIAGVDYTEYTGQSDAGEKAVMTFATPVDASARNLMGFWYRVSATTLVTDVDMVLKNSAGVTLQSFDLPAIAHANAWTWVGLDIHDFVRTQIATIEIQLAASSAKVHDFQGLYAYEYTDGFGPMGGICGVYTNRGSNPIAIGDHIGAIVGRHGAVEQAGDNATNVIGIAVTAAAIGDKVAVLEEGTCYREVDDAANVAAGDKVAATGARTVDNDVATPGQNFGEFLEAGLDGEVTKVKLSR